MKQPIKTARFIFEKWEDTPLKKKYLGSFSNFESEVRNTPECPEIFKWVITIWFEGVPDDDVDKIPDAPKNFNNIPPEDFEKGQILEATYYSDDVTAEDIEKFFKDYKIHVRRADPFFVNRETGLFGFLKFLGRVIKMFGVAAKTGGKKNSRK
jgi:hypothetical protein